MSGSRLLPIALIGGIGLAALGGAAWLLVPGDPATIELRPASAEMSVGQTQRFDAVVHDDRGHLLDAPVAWSATAGTVDTTGVYTAGDHPGSARVEVALGVLRSAADVAVRAGPPARVTVTVPRSEIRPLEAMDVTAKVEDAKGNVLGVSVNWSVEPPDAGDVQAGRFRSAGSGSARIVARTGDLSGAAEVTARCPPTANESRGAYTFRVICASSGDIWLEQGISDVDADTLVRTLDGDVGQVQGLFARRFNGRVAVLIFRTTAGFREGIGSVLKAPDPGEFAGGVFVPPSSVVINWERSRRTRPLTTMRHELTHLMISNVVGGHDSAVPAWLHEGWARLEEQTVPGSSWMADEATYCAASLGASGALPRLTDLATQQAFNAFGTSHGEAAYFIGSQAVRLLIDDLTAPGLIRVLDGMSRGGSFDGQYRVATTKTLDEFVSAYPARLRSLAGATPGAVATAESPFANSTSFLVYGFPANSSVSVTVGRNPTVGRPIDENGCYLGTLGPDWPPGTYAVTASGAAGTVRVMVRK
jgi:hypothetical protein